MKFKDANKFAVGDIIVPNGSRGYLIKKIIGIEKDSYKTTSKYEDGFHEEPTHFNKRYIDNNYELATKDIADTKTARKLYPEAEDLENGTLRILEK